MSSASVAAILAVLVLFAHAHDDDDDDNKFPAKRQGTLPKQCPPPSQKYSYDQRAWNGPIHWHRISTCCGGAWQSPIIIYPTQTRCAQHFRFYHSLAPVGRVRAQLYNSGHAAKVSFSDNYSPQIALNGVPYSLGSDYILDSVHIHVGNRRGTGSEHRVDGQGYDGEIHLVHYKRQYGTLDNASYFSDGLAVIGVFLQQSPHSPNQELNHLVQTINLLHTAPIGEKFSISLDPRRLVPASGRFYTYAGSLTTPPCSESVRWMVMADSIPTTKQNLDVLQRLQMDDSTMTMVHTNVRPSTRTNGRIVETNFNCAG